MTQSLFLHVCRKLTAEESARITTENQLQSEQAKASTAVVDADKYRCVFGLLFLLCDFISSILPFYTRPVMCEAIVVENGTKRERAKGCSTMFLIFLAIIFL